MINLKIDAIDNHGHKYAVTLERCTWKPEKLVLKLSNAPSGWHLSDLLDHKSNKLFIDMGQDWYIVNLQDVLSVARRAI